MRACSPSSSLTIHRKELIDGVERTEGLGFDPSFGAGWSVAQIPVTSGNRFRMGGLGFGLPLSRLYARYFGTSAEDGAGGGVGWVVYSMTPWHPVWGPHALERSPATPSLPALLQDFLAITHRWRLRSPLHSRVWNRHVSDLEEAGRRGLAGGVCRGLYVAHAKSIPLNMRG